MASDAYLGEWKLIPELCIYEQGEAPQQGRYMITESNDALAIRIDWTSHDGEEHHVEYGGVPDGSEHATQAPGLTHMTLTRVSSHILDSAAFNGDDEMMYARRVAHGDLLTTLQRINTANGSVSIFQVYRRTTA